MEFKEKIGQRLKEQRKAKGLTMQALADVLGVDRVTVTRYESGKLNLSSEIIDKYCVALGIEPDLTFKEKE